MTVFIAVKSGVKLIQINRCEILHQWVVEVIGP